MAMGSTGTTPRDWYRHSQHHGTRKRRRIPTFWAYAHYHCVRTHLYPPVSGIRDPVTMKAAHRSVMNRTEY
eukprot:scaffold19010_cov115-Isochrysis_galbana.AAC.2